MSLRLRRQDRCLCKDARETCVKNIKRFANYFTKQPDQEFWDKKTLKGGFDIGLNGMPPVRCRDNFVRISRDN